jgi:oligopeptidase B
MKFIFSFLLLLECFFSCFSQELNGEIKNSKGEKMPYASVYLLNLKIGTYSNQSGAFQLKTPKYFNYPKLDTLVISYVGYEIFKTPVYLTNENQELSIILKNSLNELKEFVVEALPSYPPEEIIKLAIKKTKNNYYRNYTVTNGFYRELVKENDEWIVLNEAAIQLKYAPYPQKGFIHSAFKAYYSYDYLPNMRRLGTNFYHMVRFPSYVPIEEDQVKIISSRVSINNTKYGNETSPVGGPADLVALDKIKYLYDFFDPKLIKQYNYKLFSEDFYKGELCYIIDFFPKQKYVTRVFQPFNKKMLYPIYIGRIYISAKTFAVVNFQCQLSNSIDLSIYKDDAIGIPDFLKINVEYKKHNDKWILSSVETEQRKNKTIGKETVSYMCLRSLNLEKPKIEKAEFNRDSIAYITKSATLRYFNNKYDEDFWSSYQHSSSYLKLPKFIVADLEKTMPLKKQFLSLNIPIDSIVKPFAKTQEFKHVYTADTLHDPYNWLSEKENPEVISYLNEENNYFNDVIFKLSDNIKGFYFNYNNIFKPKTDTVETIHYQTINGIKCRYKQNEIGNTGFYKLIDGDADELLIDITEASEGKPNFWIESLQFSENGKFAYAYSEKGAISNTLVITDKEPEKAIKIINIYDFGWLNDSILIYTQTDVAHRSYQLKSYNLNSKSSAFLYEEPDHTFDLAIKKSTSEKYFFMVAESKDEKEYHQISYQENKIALTPVVKRSKNHSYDIDHKEGIYFFGITNKNKGSYEVVKLPADNPAIENWKTIYVTSNPIEDFYITEDFIAVQEYNKTTLQLKCINTNSKKVKEMKFEEELFSFSFQKSKQDNSNKITIEYESPKTPYITYVIDLNDDSRKIVEKEEFMITRNNYKIEVVNAFTEKIKIPITLFYDAESIKDSLKGIILKAYGAYGAKYYPAFDAEDKIYADLGFIIAFAHVRGGGEFGESWYKEGKLLNKINTFEDYISCAKYLTDRFKIKPKQLIGYGLSAGGLIMGYAANNYPELFGTLIFDRPYLDVLNTMMDSSLALTTGEYLEWGNPNNIEYYIYIKNYSPYQNITKKNYPNMLFLAGYHDEQTPYWQIVKSVAKYRANNTSNNLILLNTDLSGGHRGSTDFNQNTNRLAAKHALIKYSLRKNNLN